MGISFEIIADTPRKGDLAQTLGHLHHTLLRSDFLEPTLITMLLGAVHRSCLVVQGSESSRPEHKKLYFLASGLALLSTETTYIIHQRAYNMKTDVGSEGLQASPHDKEGIMNSSGIEKTIYKII